jgi:hypothetical protein
MDGRRSSSAAGDAARCALVYVMYVTLARLTSAVTNILCVSLSLPPRHRALRPAADRNTNSALYSNTTRITAALLV